MRVLPILGAAVLLALLPALPAAAASGERITSYDAVLTVRTDGSLQVEETIAYDFGGEQRHGIERDIVTEQRYDDTHDRRYPVSGVTVSSPDAPAQAEVSGGGAETTVRIGDPDRTVTGRHTYVISYTVAAATTAFGDHDELFWNAYGPQWSVPVDAVTVRVTGAPVTKATCLMGRPGSTAGCPSATFSGSTATFRGGPLDDGGVLTVVTAFPAGSVASAPPVLSERMTAERFLIGRPALALPLILLALGAPLLLLILGLRRRRAQEEPALADRSQQRSTPPDGLRPLLANTLLSGRFKPVDPIAVLLDLSARRYVSITQVSRSGWELEVRHRPDDALAQEDVAVLRAAFGTGAGTTLAVAARRLASARKPLRAYARREAVDVGWYSSPPGTGRTWPMVLGVIIIVGTLPLTLLLGFAAHAGSAGLALLVGGVLMIVHGRTRPEPRTAAGEVARSQLIAYRQALTGIDPTRLPPDQRAAALDRMLPYAVALGLAPQVAAAFAGVGVVGEGYVTPYAGSTWSTFASDATSASTGSGSGFSGGSAGGGGGGGGGGSW
jgi:Predicted membrane protein (DUF2207)